MKLRAICQALAVSLSLCVATSALAQHAPVPAFYRHTWPFLTARMV